MERIRRGESQSRYGVRGWLDDATEDFLRANTGWRRSRAAKKAAQRLNVPVDDMVDVVREPRPVSERRRDRHPTDPNNTRNCATCEGSVVLDGRPCPRCLAEQQRRNAEWEEQQRRNAEWKDGMRPIGDVERPTCVRCRVTYAQPGSANCPACDRAEGNYPTDTPTARIYLFPDVKKIEKEIDMANAEVTGLPTAIAYAAEVAATHQQFNSEGYAGALQRLGFGDTVLSLEGEAREASATATAKWTALAEEMQKFHGGREFYQSNRTRRTRRPWSTSDPGFFRGAQTGLVCAAAVEAWGACLREMPWTPDPSR
ncbi:hypothetical protein QTQ03_28040 [Micromonospora sp. WMMA1363]|uniref:hypothetical protein n=1 Tax=Micromonospora sp. WMMA1363 TaxID=3053985 RepID=UPI00259CFA43|nr:hypothetical protein [Micromonospora sp. WMMA1363]MDM4723260.1 hypothetical protein [Micromonospora sp. WMMA1363]